MNRADHDFDWMSLKVLALFSDSSLIAFVIPVSLNSRKVNISLLLKCFLIFLVELFLKCLNTNCFRDFFFRARDIFFDLRVFVKFVKYLFRVCDFSYYLWLFCYFSDCVSGFTFIREETFYGLPEFFSVPILLEFKLKYCCFAFLRTYIHLFLSLYSFANLR